jgi:Fic family protein
MANNPLYIYQEPRWPALSWENGKIIGLLAKLRYQQGLALGEFNARFSEKEKAEITARLLTAESLGSEPQLTSYLTAQLCQKEASLAHDLDGIAECLLDQCLNQGLLDHERLGNWHAAMFSQGRSGMRKIPTGKWRHGDEGEMYIVSGHGEQETIHYIAPPADTIQREISMWLDWVNSAQDEHELDPFIKSAIAHLWFLIIHPFADGNGRMARAITEYINHQVIKSPYRCYSISLAIMNNKKSYYDALQYTQIHGLDITPWISWYLNCCLDAVMTSIKSMGQPQAQLMDQFNKRQMHMITQLQSQSRHRITAKDWSELMRCSPDTALRDIQALISRGILTKGPSGGRSAYYELSSRIFHETQ